MKQENDLQEKKSKKNKQTGPGHLKERNHFDAKDMLLLVVMLIIIYGIITWIEFFVQEYGTDPQQDVNIETTLESDQTTE